MNNTTKPTDYQLMQLYRDWWEASYGKAPNSQATIIAAAFGRHVLDTYGLDHAIATFGKKDQEAEP